jgi:hypothetical protein
VNSPNVRSRMLLTCLGSRARSLLRERIVDCSLCSVRSSYFEKLLQVRKNCENNSVKRARIAS